MVEIFDMTNVEPDLSILDHNNDPEHLDISQLRLTISAFYLYYEFLTEGHPWNHNSPPLFKPLSTEIKQTLNPGSASTSPLGSS